jgi:hypothetical protein
LALSSLEVGEHNSTGCSSTIADSVTVMATNTVDSTGAAIAIVFIACFAVGYNEALALPICSIAIKDQRDIGSVYPLPSAI